MRNIQIGLTQKVILSIILIGVILTALFIPIEGSLFMHTLHTQQRMEWETSSRNAVNSADWFLARAKNAAIQCSNLYQLSSGNRNEISSALMNFQGLYSDWLRRAYYVDNLGTMYSSYQVDLEVLERTMNYSLPRELTRDTPANGAVVLSDVYRSSMITSNTIAVCRRVPAPRGENAGAVMLELDLQDMGQSITSMFGVVQPFFILVSGQGRCIYINSQVQNNAPLIERMAEAPVGWTSISNEQNMHYQTYRLNSSDESDWGIVIALEESDVYASLYKLIRDGLVISALLFIGVIFFLSVVVGHSIRPIKKLATQMNAITLSDHLMVYEPLTQRDEIGDLSRSFALLLSHIRSLMEQQEKTRQQQHESEIRALQYQLRPHFLYNTLNAISALALKGETNKIPPAVSALIHMLAMNTDKFSTFVPLKEEIQYMEEFVSIMRLRFGERFDLSIRIPESLNSMILPKLVLQPIIENCIFHGFVQLDRRGLIVVEGRESEKNLRITVMDNGNGMTLEQSREALVLHPETTGLRSTGLANTHSRLQLYFGPAYGLRIISVEGVGTSVTVELPIIRDLKEMEEYIHDNSY